MKYSIIIPTYNSAELLIRLIETIPERNDIEIIIIDDNSDPRELEFLKKQEFFKRIIFLKNNSFKKGAGVCRNIGINKAKGTFLIFADSDDFFLDNFDEILEKNKESRNDITYFMTTSCYSDTLKLSNRHLNFNNMLKKYLKNRDEKSLDEVKYKFIVPWAKIYRKDFILKNKIRFDEVLASNDVMFSIKTAYFANKIDIVNEVMYCVTTTKGSLTKRKNIEIFNARFLVTVERNKFLEKINKKHLCTTGLNYLINSKDYGINQTFKILPFVLKNIFYIRFTFKNIPHILKVRFFEKRDKKYFTN